MITMVMWVSSAWATEYEPLLHGPGFVAFTPLAISHGRSVYVPNDDTSGTCFGVGMGTNLSVVDFIRGKHEGLHVQDFIGADFDFGIRTGRLYEGTAWGRVRFELGVTAIYESEDLDAWLRFGPYAGYDGAQTSGFNQGSDGGWRASIGVAASGFSLEIGPGVGMGDGGTPGTHRTLQLRSFVGVSERLGLGVEAESFRARGGGDFDRQADGFNQTTATRVQFMIRTL